ncbi:hypothetical protein R3P38DRAFT_528361 [Favolaschia claudopus]|uniref:Uncharacterized protein n=1 Tax=Favolaschia claudopus TaxID=2862362 RepID=A0AAW0CHB1_9AGAR
MRDSTITFVTILYIVRSSIDTANIRLKMLLPLPLPPCAPPAHPPPVSHISYLPDHRHVPSSINGHGRSLIDTLARRCIRSALHVCAIAHAWPLLTPLVIALPRAKRAAPPNVRLYGLWDLASRCQRLRTLAIEVDAEVADAFRAWNDSSGADGEDSSESRRTLSGHSVVMEELMLFSSPCGDKPLLVADFLNRAFPRLPERAFHVYWSGERQDGRQWWDVVAEVLGHH